MGDRAEAIRRISEVTRTGATELDLSNLGLTTLEFADLLPGIQRIPGLKALNIEGNDLRTLPNGITALSTLEILKLNANKLTSLPKDIGSLTELQELSVRENRIPVLPDSIVNLKKLRTLDVHKNTLSELPARIGELEALESLDAAANNLQYLPDSIVDPRNLTFLDVSDNLLSSLPELIGSMTALNKLNASDNMIGSLPASIVWLKNLRVLDLDRNLLTTLPENIGGLEEVEIAEATRSPGLENLEQLYLCDNQLTTVPRSIYLLRQLVDLNMSGNPLNPQTRTELNDYFGEVLVDNMAAFDEEVDHRDVLRVLYGEEAAEDMAAHIDALNLGYFAVGSGEQIKTAREVMIEFLKKTPIDGIRSEQVYVPTARYILDKVLDTEIPNEDRLEALSKTAPFLGDCTTPVKNYLEQVFIGDYRAIGMQDEKVVHGLIVAMAMEEHLLKKLTGRFRRNEKVEQVQGLLNSLFLEGAENHEDNKVKIRGDRPRMPSTTLYVGFAFDQVTNLLAKEFAKLCCKTNDQGMALQDFEGLYTLAPEKLQGITETFYAERGIKSKRESLINLYKDEIDIILTKTELFVHIGEEGVDALLNIQEQQQELREQLLCVSDDELQNTFDSFLLSKQAEITKKSGELGPQVNQSQEEGQTRTTPERGLEALRRPVNERKRSRSPENSGSAPENSQGQSPKRQRPRSPSR